MNKFLKQKKGFISFFALIICLIVSIFTVNCMGLTHSNTAALNVKRSMEKANLIAAYSADGSIDPEGYTVYEQVNTEEAVRNYFELLGRNIGLEGPAPYTCIKQYNGNNIIFQYAGYQDINTTGCLLSKTPKVWVGIFKPEELSYNTTGSEAEKTSEFVSILHNIIQTTTFSSDARINTNIQKQIINQLDLNNNGESSIITDTRTIVLSFAEIPNDASAFGIDTVYRFSIVRVKISICKHVYKNYVDENGDLKEAPCAATCLICGRIRDVDLHTTKYICQRQCIYCKENISSTTEHYIDGVADPVIGFEPHTVSGAVSCIAVSRCDVCSQIIPANGHSYGAWSVIKQANCTENEVSAQICSVCGQQKEKFTKVALGHDYQLATCSRPSYCPVCKGETGVKKEHTFTAWEVSIETTCYDDGLYIRYCSTPGCYYSKTGYSGTHPLYPQNITTLESESYLFESVKHSPGHVWGASVITNINTNIQSEYQQCLNCDEMRMRQINLTDSTQTTEWVVIDGEQICLYLKSCKFADNGNGTHSCVRCGETKNHTFNTTTTQHTCVCGFTENHNFAVNANTHSCSICGFETTHTYTKVNDTQHSCICGKISEHTFKSTNNDIHTCQDCSATQTHNFVSRAASTHTCTGCGKLEGHSDILVDNGDGTHTCPRCDVKSVAHIYISDGITQTEVGGTHTCPCGVSGNHVWDENINGKTSTTCSVCNQTMPVYKLTYPDSTGATITSYHRAYTTTTITYGSSEKTVETISRYGQFTMNGICFKCSSRPYGSIYLDYYRIMQPTYYAYGSVSFSERLSTTIDITHRTNTSISKDYTKHVGNIGADTSKKYTFTQGAHEWIVYTSSSKTSNPREIRIYVSNLGDTGSCSYGSSQSIIPLTMPTNTY